MRPALHFFACVGRVRRNHADGVALLFCFKPKISKLVELAAWDMKWLITFFLWLSTVQYVQSVIL